MTGDLATGILTSTTFELPGYTVSEPCNLSFLHSTASAARPARWPAGHVEGVG